jgi:hypothetical protein
VQGKYKNNPAAVASTAIHGRNRTASRECEGLEFFDAIVGGHSKTYIPASDGHCRSNGRRYPSRIPVVDVRVACQGPPHR